MGYKNQFYELIDKGREGKNVGLSIGLPKLSNYCDGYVQGTSFLLGAGSGVGCELGCTPLKETAVPIEESMELLQTNIGEDCDVNTEITSEPKESEAS